MHPNSIIPNSSMGPEYLHLLSFQPIYLLFAVLVLLPTFTNSMELSLQTLFLPFQKCNIMLISFDNEDIDQSAISVLDGMQVPYLFVKYNHVLPVCWVNAKDS